MITRAVRPGTAFASPATTAGVLAVVGLFLIAFVTVESLGAEAFSALLVGLVLFAITVPIAVGLARADDDPLLLRILLLAFGAKMIGVIVRFTVLKDVYGGGDADRYFQTGVNLAKDWSSTLTGGGSGTRFTEQLSGVVYRVIPDEQLAGFVVFGWFAYLGLVLFTRALRVAVPNADHRRYTVLVLFLPSLVFWPASLGKESWMLLMLGLASYGAAQLLTHRWSGVVPLAFGLWGMSAVRPHLSLIFMSALFIGWFFRSGGKNRLGLGPFLRLGGLFVLIMVTLVFVSQSEEFFGIERLDQEGTEEALEQTSERTSQGGSEFSSRQVSTPADFPIAAITVLFRPFPWEATSPLQLLIAVEGVALFGLLATSARRLRSLGREPGSLAYLVFAAVFCMSFIVAFSSVSNFGILVRQRVQMLPFLLVLVSLLLASKKGSGETATLAPDRAPAGG